MGGNIPPRCQGICPAEGLDLSEYPVVFTRNCMGPGEVTDYVDQNVTLAKDGAMTVRAAVGVVTPQRTCRNGGFNESLRTHAEAQGLGWDPTTRRPEDVGFDYTDLD